MLHVTVLVIFVGINIFTSNHALFVPSFKCERSTYQSSSVAVTTGMRLFSSQIVSPFDTQSNNVEKSPTVDDGDADWV